MSVELGERGTVRIAWLVTIAVLAVVYAELVVPAARMAGARETQAHDLWAVAGGTARTPAALARLRSAALRAERDLAATRRQGTGAGADAIVQLLDDARMHGHVAIDRYASAGTRNAPPSIAITLRGTYANVLFAVAAFSRGRPLLEVRHVSLVASSGALGLPDVTAVVDAALYRDLNELKERPLP